MKVLSCILGILGRLCHQYPNLLMLDSRERWLAASRPFANGHKAGGLMSTILVVMVVTILAMLLFWLLVSGIRYVNRLKQKNAELTSTINRLQRQINKLKGWNTP